MIIRMIHQLQLRLACLSGRRTTLAEANRLGIADDTIVIFTGDNGTDLQAPRQTDAGAVAGG